MSITSVSSYASLWPWQSLQNQGTPGSGTTTTTGDSITNTGTVSSNANIVAYLQAFSADLQSMLTQMGNDASASVNSVTNGGTTSSTTASATSSADPTQTPNASHRHHHPHGHGEGEGGPMDDAASQLVGGIGGATQGSTLTLSQITQSASLFATDVMRALQSYGSVAPDGSISPPRSTVA